MRFARLAFFLLAPLLLTAAARAQIVRWETGDDPGAISLVFENCSPDGDPQLPTSTGVQFTFVGNSESSQFSFGSGGSNSQRSVTMHYRVRARSGTAISIPAFDV